MGVTTPTVPGLCGDEDKMSERCGQVATAIVQSVTPRLPDLHRKIAAAELVLCKTFENIFGIHQGTDSADRPFKVLCYRLGFRFKKAESVDSVAGFPLFTCLRNSWEHGCFLHHAIGEARINRGDTPYRMEMTANEIFVISEVLGGDF